MKAKLTVKLDLTPALNVTDSQLEHFLKELRGELMITVCDKVNEKKTTLLQTSQVEILPARIKNVDEYSAGVKASP